MKSVALFPLTLSSELVQLEPLSLAHVEALVVAASESRATYRLTQVPDGLDAMRSYIEAALADAAAGLCVPFVTIDRRRGQVVGSTRFGNLERWSWPVPPLTPRMLDAVEIGWTWLAASAQRTHVNTSAKLLMLDHAFHVWRVERVSLKTDARNTRSRANIERIGGQLDGIWRAHQPAWDGGVRDTAFYSILRVEWPAARERLLARSRTGTS